MFSFIALQCKSQPVHKKNEKGPAPLKLPFGLKSSLDTPYESQYFEDLIYPNIADLIDSGWTTAALKLVHFYQLPPIRRIVYKSLSFADSGKCADGSLFETHIKLSKYRYRLPDIGKLQCYYWCDYDNNNREYDAAERDNCQACLFTEYGYLIVYNPDDQSANVLTLYFDTYRDGESLYRNFYIDKNYQIYLTDTSLDADDNDKQPIRGYPVRYQAKIDSQGSFVVTRVK